MKLSSKYNYLLEIRTLVGVTMILTFDLTQEKEKEKEKRELGIKYLSQNKASKQNEALQTS